MGLKVTGKTVILIKSGLASPFGGAFLEPLFPSEPVQDITTKGRVVEEAMDICSCYPSTIKDTTVIPAGPLAPLVNPQKGAGPFSDHLGLAHMNFIPLNPNAVDQATAGDFTDYFLLLQECLNWE